MAHAPVERSQESDRSLGLIAGVAALLLAALCLQCFAMGVPFDWREPLRWGRMWPGVLVAAVSVALLGAACVQCLLGGARMGCGSRPAPMGPSIAGAVSRAIPIVIAAGMCAMALWSIDLLIRSVIRNVVASEVASVAVLAGAILASLAARRVPRGRRELSAWCASVGAFGAGSWIALVALVSSPQWGLSWGLSEGRWIELSLAASLWVGIACGTAAVAIDRRARTPGAVTYHPAP